MYGSDRYRLRESSDVKICIDYIEADLVGQHLKITLMNEAAPLSRSGSWVLLDLLITVLVFIFRFLSL